MTINYGAIEHTMEQMDIPKIRERRKAYEMFIEEALLCMELNNDPGISFTRILLHCHCTHRLIQVIVLI